MKKVILTCLLGAIFCVSANASDGGYYTETETYTNNVSFNFDTITYYDDAYRPMPTKAAPVRNIRPCTGRVASSADLARPCPVAAGEPVRVKTHTEVIDHYQVYQPVVHYVPAGTYSQRRIIDTPAPRPRCNRCNG